MRRVWGISFPYNEFDKLEPGLTSALEEIKKPILKYPYKNLFGLISCLPGKHSLAQFFTMLLHGVSDA
jgi:hypothetical protein